MYHTLFKINLWRHNWLKMVENLQIQHLHFSVFYTFKKPNILNFICNKSERTVPLWGLQHTFQAQQPLVTQRFGLCWDTDQRNSGGWWRAENNSIFHSPNLDNTYSRLAILASNCVDNGYMTWIKIILLVEYLVNLYPWMSTG